MNIYVFGNVDIEHDNKPILMINRLRSDFPQYSFIEVKPNEEVTFDNEDSVMIIDSIEGLFLPDIMDESQIDQISAMSSSSVHDYDLGFQLKYLKKLGKINKVRILGIPTDFNLDYSTFQSIFKKFVAQDIQGS